MYLLAKMEALFLKLLAKKVNTITSRPIRSNIVKITNASKNELNMSFLAFKCFL